MKTAPERSADELRLELDDLRARQARRAGFVAQVAHDLRTPLTAVIGSVQTLRQRGGALSPEQHAALLELIESEARHVAELLGQVFDSARLEADGFSYSFADVEVPELVEQACAAATAGGEVEVVRHVEGGLPVIHGDRERLRQALANLLGNAVKFAPAGTAVEVAAAAVDGSVVVSVTDHGDGIALEHQELIFEQYGRVIGTAKPGTGLGLYIARSIAEAHGGTLGVSSAPGEGATFSLTLPRA